MYPLGLPAPAHSSAVPAGEECSEVESGLGPGRQAEHLEWAIAEVALPARPGGRRALTQAYLGVYVFAPRHAGRWLAEEGSDFPGL